MRVDRPGQASRVLPVRYTFGVEPLQQYVVDVGRGRLQVLPFGWDTRQRTAGGGRWFHLHGKVRIRPGDPLHWEGPQYTWNGMCADCHSTAVERGYDERTDSYATRFSDEDVACEACHGPGSGHLAWANAAPRRADVGKGLERKLDLPAARRWHLAEGARIASLHGAEVEGGSEQLEACAPCHSRRGDLGPGAGDGFHDRYRLSLLTEPGYHADGRIHDEVFDFGSFLQSKMHARGVVCSDCHDPHSQRLRAEGNALCNQCHRAEVYDSPAHHFHEVGSEGALCTSCHMQSTTYMQVDPRRDHSFRVPQPALAHRIGAPDPCTSCHGERGAAWAERQLAARFPARSAARPPGDALWRARTGQIGAADALRSLSSTSDVAPIVRATALAELSAFPDPPFPALVQAEARAVDPLLRRAAATAAAALPPAERVQILAALLADPVRSVRIEAAEALLDVPEQSLDANTRRLFSSALSEYRAAQEANVSDSGALVNLAELALRSGDYAQAEALLLRATQRDAAFTAAHLNLADSYRQRGDDARALSTLSAALTVAADPALIRHALGLTLIRLGRKDDGLDELRRAVEQDPGHSRLGYVYAVALFDLGKREQAVQVLERLHRERPGDSSTLQTLAHYLQQLGRTERARELLATVSGESPLPSRASP